MSFERAQAFYDNETPEDRLWYLDDEDFEEEPDLGRDEED